MTNKQTHTKNIGVILALARREKKMPGELIRRALGCVNRPRCRLLALRRQSKGLIHYNDLALHFADGADTYSIVSKGIPDQALVS